MIAGFIVTGSDPKRVLLRAIGPSLKSGDEPLEGRMADPTLELYDQDGNSIMFNDNWRNSPDREDIESSGLAPEHPREAVITLVLNSGPYTAILRGRNNGNGIALIEAYDRNADNAAQLANISTRAFVETGDNVLIGGFIVGKQGRNTRVLTRAIGPSMKPRLPQALDDPTMELFDANGARVGFNDNWITSEQREEIAATGAPPLHEAESAILMRLRKGPYTAIVRGKGNTIGIGLVEAYNVE